MTVEEAPGPLCGHPSATLSVTYGVGDSFYLFRYCPYDPSCQLTHRSPGPTMSKSKVLLHAFGRHGGRSGLILYGPLIYSSRLSAALLCLISYLVVLLFGRLLPVQHGTVRCTQCSSRILLSPRGIGSGPRQRRDAVLLVTSHIATRAALHPLPPSLRWGVVSEPAVMPDRLLTTT
jgi:hypothetical protein